MSNVDILDAKLITLGYFRLLLVLIGLGNLTSSKLESTYSIILIKNRDSNYCKFILGPTWNIVFC